MLDVAVGLERGRFRLDARLASDAPIVAPLGRSGPGQTTLMRAIAGLRPRRRIVLMAEPLASLDAPRKSEILQYIEILRDELKLPIVYVSHAIEEVTRLADRLVLMGDGRTLAEGTVAELMGRADLKPHLGRFEAGARFPAPPAPPPHPPRPTHL